MRSYRFWFGAFASTGVIVAAACGGAQPKLGSTGMAGCGSPCTGNGLLPAAYQGTKFELDAFMRTQSQAVSECQKTDFRTLYAQAHEVGVDADAGSDQGTVLLDDVIGCALATTETLPVSKEFFDGGISGEGLMTPPADAGWPWQPVPTHWPGDVADVGAGVGRMEDIQTCLMARLNPAATPVPIFLSGPHVTRKGDPCRDFSIKEAVWLATIGDPEAGYPTIQLDVWPLSGLIHSCGRTSTGATDDDAIKAALNTRTCGTPAGAPGCGLTVHLGCELVNDCTEAIKKDGKVLEGGIWWCRNPRASCPGPDPGCIKNRPAIETHLNRDGWNTLYGSTSCKLASGLPDPSECENPDTCLK